MTTYEVITDKVFNSTTIKRTNDNGEVFWIAQDPANSDYGQYLEDVTQAVADQSELDAIAKAKADAQSQADAEKAQALADKTIRDSGIAKAVSLGFTQTQAEGMFP